VDEFAPARQSFFLRPASRLERAGRIFRIRLLPAPLSARRRRPERIQMTIMKLNDLIKIEEFFELIQKLPSIGQNMVSQFPTPRRLFYMKGATWRR
jgi:hypothetical protein